MNLQGFPWQEWLFAASLLELSDFVFLINTHCAEPRQRQVLHSLAVANAL